MLLTPTLLSLLTGCVVENGTRAIRTEDTAAPVLEVTHPAEALPPGDAALPSPLTGLDPARDPADTGAGGVDTGGAADTAETPCAGVGLAEAWSRGEAGVRMEAGGQLAVQNDGAAPICLDGWYVALAPDGTDAMFGTALPVLLPAGQAQAYPYGADVYGADVFGAGAWYAETAWWSLEAGAGLVAEELGFPAAHAPPLLAGLLEERFDSDGDGAEDHDQGIAQSLLWAALAAGPAPIIGRDPALLSLPPGAEADVLLSAADLGAVGASVTVREHVPAGLSVTGTAPPAQITALADSSTLLVWPLELAGRSGALAWSGLRYTLKNTGCVAPVQVGAAVIQWEGANGAEEAESAPMKVGCR